MACACAGFFIWNRTGDERSTVVLRPVGYEQLFYSNRRLDGDTGYVRDGTQGAKLRARHG